MTEPNATQSDKTAETAEGDAAAPPPKKRKERVGLPRPSSRRWGMNPEDRLRVMETTMVLPGTGWLMHFVLMMSMSVIVAIMGLSANSPALVIGAMLIAPLMTPVLGIAASIAMALGDAAARTAIVVVTATIGAIFFSWLIAGVLPGELLTDEVMARTAPDVRDLVVALAAGIAGSYATARPDVSSSLPGVAIAVALVPPLAVVGITLRDGEAALARGALLLYGTNLAAIVTVSTLIFVVTGFVPGRRLLTMAPRVIAGAAFAIVLVVVMGLILVTRGIGSLEARHTAEIRQATTTWLEGTFNEADVEVDGERVRIRVTGPSAPPPSAELAQRVDDILGEPADLEVTWFQGQTSRALRAAEEADRAAEAAVDRWQEQDTVIRSVVAEWLARGEGDAAYATDITIDGAGVTVEVASVVPPPPSEDLGVLLEQALGERVPSQVGWRDLSLEQAEAAQRTIQQAESAARVTTQDWIGDRSIEIADVDYDGVGLTVDLIGQERPDAAELEADLLDAVPGAQDVRVYFIQREPVIPAPTPTPSPTPTPTPEPTPTPTPTPTVTPTPTPDDG